MRYKPSSHHIASSKQGPAKAAIAVFSALLLLGYGVFFGPVEPPQNQGSVVFILALAIGAIGFVQIRSLRKTAVSLAKTSYAPTNDGISVHSDVDNFVIPYAQIRKVTIKRYTFNKEIAQIILHVNGGLAALPCLEMHEAFVSELQRHLGNIPFIEKNSLLM